MVPVGQESDRTVLGSSGSGSHMAAAKVSATPVIPRLEWKKIDPSKPVGFGGFLLCGQSLGNQLGQ